MSKKIFNFLPVIIIITLSTFLVCTGLFAPIDYTLVRGGLITLGIIGVTVSLVIFVEIKKNLS